MRLENFDSEWHFVPDRPEAINRFRRTNRAMILFFAVFVLGVFVAMLVSRPVRNAVTATHYGSPAVQKAKSLGPQHTAAAAPETR